MLPPPLQPQTPMRFASMNGHSLIFRTAAACCFDERIPICL
jgi:hypothetical protein